MKKHTFHVVTEFDITTPKRLIQDLAATTDVRLSFTAYLAACIGRAVAAQKICHAYRIGRRKLVLFDEVDIGTLIDHDVEGERMATHYVIRGAERKPVRDIHDEIRLAQRTPVTDMPGVQKWKFYLELPGFLRRLFYWWLDRSPQTRKKLSGTVLLTAPGVFGVGTGWGIPISVTTLTRHRRRRFDEAGGGRRPHRAARVHRYRAVLRPRHCRRRAGGALCDAAEAAGRERLAADRRGAGDGRQTGGGVGGISWPAWCTSFEAVRGALMWLADKGVVRTD